MPRHKTRRLTMAQALVASLDAQHIDMGRGRTEKLYGGVFAIFGHGNVSASTMLR